MSSLSPEIRRDGVTRIVLLIGSIAIKLPRFNYGWQNFLRGLLCNMQERLFASTAWPELCPVLLSIPGGWLVVMRRCRPLTEDEWCTFDFDTFANPRDWHEERIVPGKYSEQNYVPVENKPSSFGMLGGRVVAVDYGS